MLTLDADQISFSWPPSFGSDGLTDSIERMESNDFIIIHRRES
jgi:hypothetical protein